MDVLFCRSIPKKGPPKVPQLGKDPVKEIKLADWCDAHLIKRPDRDNYLKAFSDALNRIVYVDDSQIIGGDGSKDYAPQGKEGYTWAVIRSND